LFKNYKKSLIIFSIILVLFFTIASISASENLSEELSGDISEVDVNGVNDEEVSDVSSLEASEVNNNEDSSNIQVVQQTSPETLSSSSESDNVGSSDNEVLSSPEDSIKVNKVYESTQTEYSAVTQQYTSGNIVYNVKVYDVVSYDGVQYKEPKYGSVVKLRVYTGNSFKTYSGVIEDNGVASVKVPNLAVGTHTVEIFYGNEKKGTSSIKIIKSTTKVYAPAKTIKHKKNTYFGIKVFDSHGNAAKNIYLKVKVYTGKKSKTYTVKTSSVGFAKLKTKKLALGTHKITITTKDKKYKISKKTKVIIKKKVPKKAQKLTVSAPTATVKYKDSNYFPITVKNGYNNPVKKLVLKLKVYTGKKYKTVSLKTNSKGVANYQTNKLAVGTHKLVISTTNKNYKVSKTSKVVVKKTVTSNRIEPTKLKQLLYYPSGDDYYTKLTWLSKPGTSYQVLKKSTGDYDVIATVQADSDSAVYHDKVGDGVLYTYSVRELIVNNNEHLIGPHDNDGLKMITSPNVEVDFQNLKAHITWNKISDATKYRVFRKMDWDGEYKCIAVVDAKETSYTDWYYKSADELASILNSETFCEQSFNNLHYTVRACNIAEVDDVQKISYGLYLKDGDFNLESPTIVSLRDNVICWGEIPNAQGYYILKKSSETGLWEKIAQTGKTTSTTQKLNIGEIDNNAYYSVQAFANKNGVMAYSNYDKGFTLKDYSESNAEYNVLFFGDSITYASPYYATSSKHIFSMPNRIAQLTGCEFYNPSIPGSTYHDLGVKSDGTNVENTDYYRYRIPREVVDQISVGELPGNWAFLDNAKNSKGETNTKITDYNVVVLLAGTNDYLDNSELGDINTRDTFYFNGGFNHIMDKITEASNTRVAEGLSAIKVVLVDLFYSDRTHNYKQLHNRDITLNNIGLTLMDYQDALNSQFEKWSQTLDMYHFKTRDYGIVTSENCPYTASDNLHFTKFTYGQYGNALAQFFVENVFT
jgi:hypothetical protein